MGRGTKMVENHWFRVHHLVTIV